MCTRRRKRHGHGSCRDCSRLNGDCVGKRVDSGFRTKTALGCRERVVNGQRFQTAFSIVELVRIDAINLNGERVRFSRFIGVSSSVKQRIVVLVHNRSNLGSILFRGRCACSKSRIRSGRGQTDRHTCACDVLLPRNHDRQSLAAGGVGIGRQGQAADQDERQHDG